MRKQSYSELWKGQNWKQLRKNLFRLQRRVYKAVQAGDLRKARSIQKLILKSRSAQLLAIRQVTQLNQGKKTAGIDGKTALKYSERFELLERLVSSAENWTHQGLREIPIPKKNGGTRMLKVPTIADRAWQCLAKFALEPAHEAKFHARSYGFRTGRSAHDAQKQIFNNLSSNKNGINKRVIELDIKKCFDKISHKSIMDKLIAPASLKTGIFRCLKAGVDLEFPEQGTPQGGVVSPLLANIALDGIEEIHPSVRYADDMVIFLKPKDNSEKVLNKIKAFLAERGMEISEEKTKITKTTDGFNFLGWYFRVQYDGRFKSYPAKENLKKFLEKIKSIVNSSNYGAEIKAKKLAPIVRGWRNYHKWCCMEDPPNNLYFPMKSAEKKFRKQKSINRYESKRLLGKAFPKVSWEENGHTMVKGIKSPYDGDLTYWSKRNSILYNNATSKALKKPNHSCGYCGLKFIDEERVHLHHIDENHDNWKPENLMAVHQSCHQYIHGSRPKGQDIQEPYEGKPSRTDLKERCSP
ncbi:MULTISPECIES: reverse transcriptase domain-containing protein [Moorena]|uniref:reverse transcriptase domain-containing protein n=2 Tax=Coleofasciculaceae TaxID=1892251 RepID=UPI0002FBFEAD|nr:MULTISPECIES: reverse transcriptase domain-containing protein [Moorena]NEP68106.1 RNA-dependent DNA polymerase [Moorena sp. SIO3A5]NER89970.1 RNA-dependent DNA polymerase [Moorena sp. SIO3A2]OLT67610.1 RNA-dependent DNA polymerase [Moorena producens 3L]